MNYDQFKFTFSPFSGDPQFLRCILKHQFLQQIEITSPYSKAINELTINDTFFLKTKPQRTNLRLTYG